MLQKQSPPPTRPLSAWLKYKLAAVRTLLWIIVRCTSLDGLYRFGQAFATCEWVVNYKRRGRFHRSMKHIFGTQYDARAMSHACRQFFIRTRCDKFFYLIFDKLPRAQLQQRIHFPERALMDASLSHGRGVYVALSHQGSQHTAGILMCFLGYQVAGVRDRNEGPLRRFIQQRFADRFSEVRTATMFYADAFPRDLYRWFAGNGILGSALDVDRDREPHLKRVTVRVFGEPKEYLSGTMQIALRCKAVIHQGFIRSRPNFHYDMILLPPLIDPQQGADRPEVLQEVMQRYADNIEDFMRRYPDHISRV